MNSTLKISVFLLISMISPKIVWASGLPENIKLFVASPYEIGLDISQIPESITIELVDFSLMKRIETSLSENLSDNPTVATQQAARRVEDNLDTLKKTLQLAAQAHVLAEKFNISRLPAAVIDNSIVVYDTTNLDEILLIWRNSKNTQ